MRPNAVFYNVAVFCRILRHRHRPRRLCHRCLRLVGRGRHALHNHLRRVGLHHQRHPCPYVRCQRRYSDGHRLHGHRCRGHLRHRHRPRRLCHDRLRLVGRGRHALHNHLRRVGLHHQRHPCPYVRCQRRYSDGHRLHGYNHLLSIDSTHRLCHYRLRLVHPVGRPVHQRHLHIRLHRLQLRLHHSQQPNAGVLHHRRADGHRLQTRPY